MRVLTAIADFFTWPRSPRGRRIRIRRLITEGFDPDRAAGVVYASGGWPLTPDEAEEVKSLLERGIPGPAGNQIRMTNQTATANTP